MIVSSELLNVFTVNPIPLTYLHSLPLGTYYPILTLYILGRIMKKLLHPGNGLKVSYQVIDTMPNSFLNSFQIQLVSTIM